MIRLKEFLQIEVRKSYRHVVKAGSTISTIENCLIDMGLISKDESFNNNLAALEIVADELIEYMENYLKMDVD